MPGKRSKLAGKEWQSFLSKNNLVASTSKLGNCHDNEVAKSLSHLLKHERIRRQTYLTRDVVRQASRKPGAPQSSGWPDGQRALERACYLRASRPKARHPVADFRSAIMVGGYATVDSHKRLAQRIGTRR